MIGFYSIDREVPDIDPELFVSALSKLIEAEGFVVGQIAVIVCSDDYLLEMNKEHLDHDYYTDIITFDYTEDGVVSGDLFVSLDRIEDNAKTLGGHLIDEFKRVCAHGVLHLCGYKDKTDDEMREMREKEDWALTLFGST